MLFFFDALLQSIVALLSYISNNNSFPKPLPPEEEKKCIDEFMNGSVEAGNKLVEHNLRLVAHIAKKYSQSTRDSEDLISIGTIGLIKGINSFDPSKGTRLATYAARCVENEILMLIRNQKKRQNDVSLNESIGTDKEGNAILLMDIISADGEGVFEEFQLSEQTKKLYENIKNELDPREREIVILRYGLGDGRCLTQREIAKMMNISRSYVSRIEKKAISKLRKGIV
ncbi:MAG TPA: RNA polymerase sporulation sigma factor SigK [Firmicutes bacterium]|nr:RNA polymerase sporulation sigma factor SigK [Bacillota bacterium]